MKGQLKYLRGDPATATQYYDEAVRLDPRSAPFYISRGMAWDARGEHKRAIGDYTQALKLQPDAKPARLARGLASFALGEFGPAAEDFAALKQDAPDLHGALWYYLAKARAGSKDGRSDLASAAARRKPNVWPSPIFQLFLGQRDAASVEAAAASPQQRCEAQFYAGEWHLLQGERPAAMQALNAATERCARVSIEYQAAAEELRRLHR